MSFRTMKKTSTEFNEKGNVIIRDDEEEKKGADPFAGGGDPRGRPGRRGGPMGMMGFGGMDDDDEGGHQFQQPEPFNPNKKFFNNNEERPFDEVIREQVYNCLLYRGDLQMMMTQAYFTDDKVYKD